jgi:hypothetical protein
MTKPRKPDGHKRKELAEAWGRLLKRHGLEPGTVRRRMRSYKPRVPDSRARAERSGTSAEAFKARLQTVPVDELRTKKTDPRADNALEIAHREGKAQERVRTVVPAYNKGPYTLVTDPALVKNGIGRKQ